METKPTFRKLPSERAAFLRRLSIYLTGVAIGFIILGMFRARSAAEARQREAARAALEAEAEASQAGLPVLPATRTTQKP